jgi:hypothetical protein
VPDSFRRTMQISLKKEISILKLNQYFFVLFLKFLARRQFSPNGPRK